jgi:hypothetical protein
MANLVTDDAGLPIPQYMDVSTGMFAAMRGKNGGIAVYDLNYDSKKIVNANILGSDGNPLIVTAAGLPVVLSDQVISVVTNAKHDYLLTDTIINTEHSRGLLVNISISSGTGTLSGIKIKAVINGNEVDYLTKTLDTPITSGSTLIIIDSMLPYKFKVYPVVDNASTLVISADIQVS